MDERELLQAARRQLESNLKTGLSPWSGQPYSYTCPSLKTYPFQWFWDSCFHAIVWSYFDLEQAKEELRTLLRAQRADGFIPHRIAWRPRLVYPYRFYLHTCSLRHPWRSELIQPAVLATALEVVQAKSDDAAFLAEALPGVEKYYHWLAQNRDPDGDDLIAIISPFESGVDHKPAYDVLYRLKGKWPRGVVIAARGVDLRNRISRYNLKRIFRLDRFNVEDVLVNCIYAQGLLSLSRLARRQGDKAKGDSYARWAQRVEEAVLSKCAEPDGLFYDLYSRQEKKAKTKSVTCLFPIILDSIDRQRVERLVREHLLNEDEFWLPYPLATVARDERSFSPSFRSVARSGLWRGPVWVCINWFIAKGLEKHGFDEVAAQIGRRTKELTLRHGFREFYNPLTGEPYGAQGFAWSTLVVDMPS